eukprot:g23689.t1
MTSERWRVAHIDYLRRAWRGCLALALLCGRFSPNVQEWSRAFVPGVPFLTSRGSQHRQHLQAGVGAYLSLEDMR